MTTETEEVNIPFILYKQSITTDSGPVCNGTPLTRSIWNNKVTNTVYKDNTPRDWRHLIKNGLNATTTLIGSETKCIKTPGYYSMTVKRGVNDSCGFRSTTTQSAWFDFLPVTKPVVGPITGESQADSIARTRFVAKANEQMQAFQGMQYLAEAKESIRMLHGNTEQLAGRTERYLNDVRKDFVREQRMRRRLPRRLRRLGDVLARLQRIVQQRYLEYSYGVAPLIGATQQAAETLVKIHMHDTVNRDWRRITAKGTALGTVKSVSAGFDVGTFLKGKYVEETQTRSTVVYRGVVGTQLDTLGQVNQFLGFSPNDFLPTVWEWLPWSFVADYFTNISEIIDGASFARGRLRWVARTSIIETTANSWQWVPDLTYPLTAYPTAKMTILNTSFTPPTVSWVIRSVSRGVYTGSLIPDFTWQMPKPGQWLKVTALLGSMRRSQDFITNFLAKK